MNSMNQIKDRLRAFLAGKKTPEEKERKPFAKSGSKKIVPGEAVSGSGTDDKPSGTPDIQKQAVKKPAPAHKPNTSPDSTTTPVKIEDERSVALGGTAISFTGDVLTAADGPIKVPEESRSLCALFDSGLWLVSASHRHSPLVTSVAQAAKRQGFKVGEPRYVTPNIIAQAYVYAERNSSSQQM